jgi:hypothetical protein
MTRTSTKATYTAFLEKIAIASFEDIKLREVHFRIFLLIE